MTKIIVGDELRTKLDGLDRATEFCSADDKPLGYFLPVKVYLDLLYSQARERFRPEEIEHLRQQRGGRTFNEIMQKLERN